MASVARPLTLADVAVPRSNALTDTFLVIIASLVTAAAARVEIRLPWTPVPITGQTFAVLLSGSVLGARRAFLAQCLYLFEGAMGLPFFAGGAAGESSRSNASTLNPAAVHISRGNGQRPSAHGM